MTYLQHTRAALAVFDAEKPAREALWQAVTDNDSFQAANAKANADVLLVQEAFHRDTAGYNRFSDCLKVTVPWIRGLVNRMDARWSAENEMSKAAKALECIG